MKYEELRCPCCGGRLVLLACSCCMAEYPIARTPNGAAVSRIRVMQNA